jgi:GR25 family glycosyltransferase involved in LPS biosynthesis
MSFVNFSSYKDLPGYIINLDREADRYTQAHHLLASLGFSNLTRWKAVDAKVDNLEEVLNEFGVSSMDKFGKYTNTGQYACALSHLSLLRCFLKSTQEHCLVFEDDVIAHTDFHKYADFPDIYWNELELLSFGGVFVHCMYEGKKYTSILETKNIQNKASHVDGAHYWQTHAYLCSRNFAHKAIEKYSTWVNESTPQKINCPYIDHYYTESGFFKTKLVVAQDRDNLKKFRMHQGYSERLCGILYQSNDFKSTIQSY